MKNYRLLLLIYFAPAVAFGHSGEPLQPHDLWNAWRLDPGIVLPLALTGFLYALGARASRGVSTREWACFWSGWLLLVLSLISPLHALGEVLFSAHMVQHEILMCAAAPLLVLSRPLIPILWGLPLGWRKALGQWSKGAIVERCWRSITQPSIAWWLHAAALWLWHAPQLFQATLTNEWIHAGQHMSFFGSAILFWWSLFYARGRTSYGASVLYLFTTGVHTSILGALLTFASTIWYPSYAGGTETWGLTPLEDQQLGGLIMWIPAGLVYLGAGLGLFALWLRESDVLANRNGYYAQ
jgi:putative membrane protein